MDSFKEFVKILTEIDNEAETEKFLKEILTSKEINDITLRWQLLKELYQGDTQRKIAERHRISLCKITRGSKLLKDKDSIMNKVLKKYYGGKDV
jgi:TrpR family trp operon transcriptional repressor